MKLLKNMAFEKINTKFVYDNQLWESGKKLSKSTNLPKVKM